MRSFTKKKEDEINSPKKINEEEDFKSKYSNQENSYIFNKNEAFSDKRSLITPESTSKKQLRELNSRLSPKINSIFPFDIPLEQAKQDGINKKIEPKTDGLLNQMKNIDINFQSNTQLTLGPIPLKEQKNDLRLKNLAKSTEESLENEELTKKDSALYYKKKELYYEETLKMKVSNHLAFILRDPSNFILDNKMERNKDRFKEKVTNHVKTKIIQEEANNFFPFHKDYHQDSPYKSYFIIADLIRQSVYTLLIIIFYDKPFLGLISILILNSFYVIMFVKIKPYKEKMDFYQNLFNEIILISVFVCTLVMASMEKFGENDLNLKMEIGWVIVIGNSTLVLLFILRMIFNIIQIICSLIKIGLIVIKSKIKKNKIFDEQIDKDNSKPKKKEKDIIQNIMEIQNFLK